MYFGGIGEQATLDAVADAGLVLDDSRTVPEDVGNGRLVDFVWITAPAVS
jgi:hypothetical protein